MISVCIASHNGEKYIKEQVDSILCQIGSDDEVVISDDGSTDKTLAILEAYNDPRIKVFRYVHPCMYRYNFDYATHNFENALHHAKGDIIFLADQDDFKEENLKRLQIEKRYSNYDKEQCIKHILSDIEPLI